MAKIAELDEGWDKWVQERPEGVRKLCIKYPPNLLYRYKPTGSRVLIVSYFEDGTVKVDVSGDYNCVVFEREVFGVDPADLEECDFPGEDEPLGVMLDDHDDVVSFIKTMKDEDNEQNPNL